MHNLIVSHSPSALRSRATMALLAVLSLAIGAAVPLVLAQWEDRPTTRLTPIHHVDISPSGWRRTIDGWERAEQWYEKSVKHRNLHDWLAFEQAAAPGLLRKLLDGARSIHPLIYSLWLAGVAVTVYLLSKADRQYPSLDEGLSSDQR